MMMEIVLICIIAYYVVGLRMWLIAPFVPAAPAMIAPAVRIAKAEIITAACMVKRPGIAPAYTGWLNKSIRLPRIRDGTDLPVEPLIKERIVERIIRKFLLLNY